MDVELNFRIPGCWDSGAALLGKLPKGYQVAAGNLELPDGNRVMLRFLPRDNQFVTIFRRSCRTPLSAMSVEKLENYSWIAGIVGPGGSMDSARTMVQAAAALLRAGGLGVFIDNSAIAHSRQDWLRIAKDGTADALCFGFMGIVGSPEEVWTHGMHAVGLPDIVSPRPNPFEGTTTLVEFARFVCAREQAVEEGYVFESGAGGRFQVERMSLDEFKPTSPIHNPFGRIRLVPLEPPAG